jgi:hypothetical protein
MASDVHQSLLLWISRKMALDGFLLCNSDGPMPQGGYWNQLPQAPEVSGFRADACGVLPLTGEFAFGEAKTYQDIDTEHTRKQLRIFGYLKHRDGRTMCRLYFAVPRSAAIGLDRVLRDVGLLGAPHIVRLHIPDCFVTDELR